MTFGKIKDPFISLLSHICKLFSREVTNYLTRRFNEKKKTTSSLLFLISEVPKGL